MGYGCELCLAVSGSSVFTSHQGLRLCTLPWFWVDLRLDEFLHQVSVVISLGCMIVKPILWPELRNHDLVSLAKTRTKVTPSKPAHLLTTRTGIRITPSKQIHLLTTLSLRIFFSNGGIIFPENCMKGLEYGGGWEIRIDNQNSHPLTRCEIDLQWGMRGRGAVRQIACELTNFNQV